MAIPPNTILIVSHHPEVNVREFVRDAPGRSAGSARRDA
jgi:hypothetical protein